MGSQISVSPLLGPRCNRELQLSSIFQNVELDCFRAHSRKTPRHQRPSPRINPEPSKGMQAMHLRRAQPSPPLRRTPLRTPPHQRSRGALHPVSCWHRLAHLQSFLDTIHTDAAVYVFSALLPPPSCPQKVNQNSLTHATISGLVHCVLRCVRTTYPLVHCVSPLPAHSAPEPRRWSPTAPG